MMKTEIFEKQTKITPTFSIEGQQIVVEGLSEIIGDSYVKREKVDCGLESVWERQEDGRWRTTFTL